MQIITLLVTLLSNAVEFYKQEFSFHFQKEPVSIRACIGHILVTLVSTYKDQFLWNNVLREAASIHAASYQFKVKVSVLLKQALLQELSLLLPKFVWLTKNRVQRPANIFCMAISLSFAPILDENFLLRFQVYKSYLEINKVSHVYLPTKLLFL